MPLILLQKLHRGLAVTLDKLESDTFAPNSPGGLSYFLDGATAHNNGNFINSIPKNELLGYLKQRDKNNGVASISATPTISSPSSSSAIPSFYQRRNRPSYQTDH
jgi:hypothetical protein